MPTAPTGPDPQLDPQPEPQPEPPPTADPARPLVAVTGVTGYVGGRLVPELLDAGYRVRAIARNPARLRGRPWYGQVDIVAADAGDPDQISAALAGVDVA